MPSAPELFAFPECRPLARALAGELGAELRDVDVHHFPDGESLVRAVRQGDGPAVLLRSLDDPNRKLVEVLLTADALRRQGVERLILVAPYLGYMRQDKVFEIGQSLSQRVVANLLSDAFDEVWSVEAHLHRIKALSEVFSCPARSISAAPAITRWLRDDEASSLLIGPDSESEPWIRAIAEEAGLPFSIASKVRHGDHHVRIDLPALPPGTRRVWIVDDIGSSGTTLQTLSRILVERGIEQIGAIVVHALFAPDTPKRLREAGIETLISADGIVHETNAIGLAPLLAGEMRAAGAARRET